MWSMLCWTILEYCIHLMVGLDGGAVGGECNVVVVQVLPDPCRYNDVDGATHCGLSSHPFVPPALLETAKFLGKSQGRTGTSTPKVDSCRPSRVTPQIAISHL